MAIAHQGTTTPGAIAPGGSVTIPATATTGRLIVLFCSQNATVAPTITATGYTNKVQSNNTSTSQCVQILYKVAGGSDAGSSLVVNSTEAQTIQVNCAVFSGVDTTTPVNTAASTNLSSMSSTTVTMTAFTMDNANSVIFAYSKNNGNATNTWSAGTERMDIAGHSSMDEQLTASGSTGTRTSTLSVSAVGWCCVAIGINQAVAAGATSLIFERVSSLHRTLRSM